MHRREWGTGRPVIAMHPLGLESSAFEGLGQALARRGMRTVAVDLPGFGRTPMPEAPLSPAVMAAPVVTLARTLHPAPILVGISMGGRVALEAALMAPDAFGGVVAIAPYLPWLRFRLLLQWSALLRPEMAAWFPLERLWPVLRPLARGLETIPWLRDDEVAQAGARLVYYLSCPATRASFLSAAREMALDPALGEGGFWTRLPQLAVPTAFVWGERDQLVSLRFSRPIARTMPHASQMLLPCLGHWLNGPHHRCLAATVADTIPELLGEPSGAPLQRHGSGVEFIMRPCVVPGGERSTAPAPIREEAEHGT